MDTLGSKERKIELALKGSFPLGPAEGGLEATTCPVLTRGRGEGERENGPKGGVRGHSLPWPWPWPALMP